VDGPFEAAVTAVTPFRVEKAKTATPLEVAAPFCCALRIAMLRRRFTVPLLGLFPTADGSCTRSASGFQADWEISDAHVTSNAASGGKFISLHGPHDVRYWTRSLGCTKDELREAVMAIG
jgi:hypothetical protein